MEIHRFNVGPFAENSYLLIEGDEGLLVDPGFADQQEFNKVQSIVDRKEVDLNYVLLTHAHVDHALGLHRVLDHYDIPVYLSDKDYYLWNNFESQAQMFGLKARGFDFIPEVLPVSSAWSIANFNFDVRYTPGHSPDHLSLYLPDENIVIAGDALFKEGIGRTDLYKGSMELLKKSIQEKLYTLPDDTTVYPGHGPNTTIGHEKQSNPFVRG
ncbi:MBL fold metallo-hydrolase [Aliifodinibius salicampi]|uniref:MBL fold metallo-hydrolase n=1 Tax=Fodinibius salicampi TaxID=1920655 RepID=A0ABT3PVY8_9BACT|nr:MBL fold metallo-hydrolase [Fodinibius salicampi]MCW9712007.1 MBL fold metallo-hydrolase [Fodinibius salicampi]